MSKFFTLLLAFIVTVFISSCKGDENKIKPGDAGPRGEQQSLKTSVYIVKTMAVSDNITLPGTILANEVTDIYPEISGRLTYLNVAEGRNVSQGTLIGRIYDGDLQAQLKKLQVQLSMAKRTTERYAELRKIDGVSKQEYDIQALDVNNIQADIAIVQSNIRRTRITAPFSGTLGLRNVSQGAYVSPSTIITTIRQNSRLKIDFNVPETYAAKIKPGQVIDFTIDGNNKTYTAKIIASEMGLTTDTRSLLARAEIISKDKELLPGLFVKVNTSFDPDPNAIMVPSNAIISGAREKQVGIAREGKVVMTTVTTGIRDSANVEIISGLRVGDTVITSALMNLKEGMPVQITSFEK